MTVPRQFFLNGETIYLRALQEKDAYSGYVEWLNDEDVCQYNSHHVFPYVEKQALDFIKGVMLSRNQLVLAICSKENDTHIGNISLQDINYVNRSAEFAILLGDKSYWGCGIGREAGALLIKHGFMELNLNRIACGTSVENIGMQKLAVALGMKKEGLRKQGLFKHGRYIDIIEYGIVLEDYVQN